MDPVATYKAYLAAVEAGELSAACGLRMAYNEWRDRGGFPAVIGFLADSEDHETIDRIPPLEVEGQDPARGILAVNPEEEGSPEWHAWALGYAYAERSGGAYDAPLSGEWANMPSVDAVLAQVEELADVELEVDAFDSVETAYELGYATYREGWRV